MQDEILKLIEEVDPSDTAKLDEIDARVDAYVSGRPFNGYDHKTGLYETIDGNEACEWNPHSYTRSRDALKAIRPHQGHSLFRLFNSDSWDTWQAQIAWYPTSVAKYCTSPHLPTEELAELHAIIQAIAYERGQP